MVQTDTFAAVSRDHSSTARLRTSRAARVSALLICATLLVVTGFALPHSTEALLPVAAFYPMFVALVFVLEGLTAYLLWIQFYHDRDPSIGMLASAYAFTAPLVLVQLCVFPGVFVAGGLVNAVPSAAVWLWVFWHGGFPTLILAAMMARLLPRRDEVSQKRFRLIFEAYLLFPIILIVAVTWLVIGHGEWLPQIINGASYSGLASSPAGIYVIVVNLLATGSVILIGRGRSPLYLWLTVAIFAALCDAGLTLAGGARFSLGWYASRCMSLVAASAVLIFTLFEVTRMYLQLASANSMLRQFATLDGLTGLANRRQFDSLLDSEMRRFARTHRPLSLVMLDVDHFKLFNDTFGHLAGDECLKVVAECARAVARRPGELAARFGGEEFAVILPETDLTSAAHFAQTLRSSIEARAIAAPSNPSGWPVLTASFGVATAVAGASALDLIAAADAALYEAKSKGRNRVEEAPEAILPKLGARATVEASSSADVAVVGVQH